MRHFPLFSLAIAIGISGCDRAAPPSPAATSGSAVAIAAPKPSASSSSAAAADSAPEQHGVAKLPADMNVILITVDSMRADQPWAGYARPVAPNLTALEKKSVSYTKAYALSSYTSMSVGGFLAGNYPGAVKRDGFFFGTYPKDDLMFPERLQEAGVKTMSAQAHGYFKVGTGLSQGFDVWKLVPNLKWNAQTDENVTSEPMEKLAEEELGDAENTKGKFFAWYHFMDPHDQYMPHKDGTDFGKKYPIEGGSKGRDLYDGELEYADQFIGKLLTFIAAQPWAAKTAIIISADHGEAFGEHSVYRHGFEVFQQLIHVPWFFVLPGVAPKHIDVARSHLDLAPTILDLLGVKADPPLPGVSLVAEITGTETPGPRDVISDLPRTSDNDRRRAVISGKYKVIAYGDDAYFQVYDLDVDPDEKVDLVKTDKETARKMIEKYKDAVKGIKDVKPYACTTLKGTPDNP